jgi:hypothetical protein
MRAPGVVWNRMGAPGFVRANGGFTGFECRRA